MFHISKYIIKQLFISTTIITCVMSGVIWLFIAVKIIESIVNRGVSLKLFFTLTVLQLPNFLSQVLPIALFISVLYVYSKLNSDREVTILKSAGLNPFSIAKPAILLSLFITVCVYILSLYGTPFTYKLFRDLQWDLRYSLAGIVLKEGVFNTFSDDITVYVRERIGDHELGNIMVHDSRNKSRPITYHAKRGIFTKSDNSAKVILIDGTSIIIDKQKPEINRIVFFDRHIMNLNNIVEKPLARFREARERGTFELISLQQTDLGNPRDFGKFRVEIHQRIINPITTLGFTLVALTCLLIGDFSRKGSSRRVMLAVLIFVSLIAGNLALTPLCSKNLNLIPTLYLVALLPIALASFTLFAPTSVTSWYNKMYSHLKISALK